MLELFTHPSNIVFSISLSLMLMFAALEFVFLFLGGGSQNLLDHFLSENSQQSDVSVDTETGFIAKIFDWLYLGRLPLFIWIIIFLSCYGFLGLFLQGLFEHFNGQPLNIWIISPICIFLCMPFVHYAAMLIYKILPKNESISFFSDELLGRNATIVLGTAKPNLPAQAKVKDQNGYIHYVMVEPEDDDTFNQGQVVVLTQKTKSGFQATVA